MSAQQLCSQLQSRAGRVGVCTGHACWQSRQGMPVNAAGHCADHTPQPRRLSRARARAQPRLAGGSVRPQKRAAAPQKRPRGGGRGRGRSLLGPGGGERGGALGKRRRGDYDLHEMVAPAAGGGGGPRFVERVQVCPDGSRSSDRAVSLRPSSSTPCRLCRHSSAPVISPWRCASCVGGLSTARKTRPGLESVLHQVC